MANDTSLQTFQKEIQLGPRPVYNVQLRLYDIIIPAIGLFIILINLLVVLSSGLILRKRQQPRSTYIFLGNVALADMLTGAATLFGQYYPKDIRTEMVCCIQIGMIVSATVASIYSIALIAIDRYLYILYGLQYQRYMASKRARLMVLGTWILGGIVGFLPAMGIRNPTDGGRFCWLIILEPTALILSTVTVGIIPLFLIIILYGIILKLALGKISEMRYTETTGQVACIEKNSQLRYYRGGRGSNATEVGDTADGIRDVRLNSIQEDVAVGESSRTRRSIFNCFRKTSSIKISSVYSPSRWKAIKIVLLTTGCFFITWFPYFLACALYAMCNKDSAPEYCNSLRIAIASPLAILGLANSLLNPIIYAWWHNGFRETAKKIFNDIWRRRILALFHRDEISLDNRRKASRPGEESSSQATTSTNVSNVAQNNADRSQVKKADVHLENVNNHI